MRQTEITMTQSLLTQHTDGSYENRKQKMTIHRQQDNEQQTLGRTWATFTIGNKNGLGGKTVCVLSTTTSRVY